MANLVELFDNIVQMQNLNGVPLAAGKLYVYALGRTRLMDSWSDVDGESLNPNPIILDDAGQAHVYVSSDFDYTLVVCDQYNNEIFSLDKYLYSKGSHSHADVAVAPSESIAVSSYHVGETTVYVPYLTGQLGKVYEGIDPIVVNNQVDKISANHVPLGVQDPLYFVQDDEEGCIIGFSGETLPEGTMNESAFGYEDGQITSYNGSAFSAGNSYEAGSYVDIDGNTINVTGLQPAGNYQSAGDYVVHDELSSYATQDWVNEQGFLTAIPSEYVTENTLQSGLSSKLDSTAFSTVSGDFLTAHQSLDGLMSADLLEISDNKITGYNGTAFAGQGGGVTGDYELSAGSGISIVDYPLEQKTVISVTAQGGNPEVEQAVIDNSATWETVTAKQDSLTFGYHDTAISSIDNSALYDNSAHARITTLAGRISDLSSNKLDTTAFSDVSGKYLPMTTSGLSASGTYLIDAISNNRILGINTSGISANPNGGVTSVQVGGYNSPEIKIKGYYGTMELNSAGAQYISFDNSVVWKVGEADHLYVTNENPDYQNIAIDISQAPRNVDTTRVMIGKNGLSACNIGSSAGMNTTYAPATIVGNSQVKVDFGNMHSVLSVGDIYVQHNGNEASSTWHLTGSVQKREIEGDTATSAITAIAGSAIGGGVPAGTMNESAFSYDASDNITAYNGSAFAGGSDVPEGVMVESGLEYNADNEISAYNGSAFATQLPEEEEVEFEELNISGISAATDYVTATSGDINATIDNVSANSGAWGGSALPISAGPGIKFELVNNTLVASVSSEWINITTACTLGAYAGNCSVYVNPAARMCWLAGAFAPSNTGNFLTVPVEYKWLTYFEAANSFNHYIDFNTNGDGNIARVRDGAGSYWSQTIMWGY